MLASSEVVCGVCDDAPSWPPLELFSGTEPSVDASIGGQRWAAPEVRATGFATNPPAIG
jgi:hypothetical protein